METEKATTAAIANQQYTESLQLTLQGYQAKLEAATAFVDYVYNQRFDSPEVTTKVCELAGKFWNANYKKGTMNNERLDTLLLYVGKRRPNRGDFGRR